MDSDPIDLIIEQWQRERPDLDLAPMALVGRALYVFAGLQRELDAFAQRWELTTGEGDVLLALRRGGAPYTATPSALAKSLMLSPAGITNRIDRLENAGLVTRELDSADRRSFRITLTPEAVRLVDKLVAKHVANEERLLEPLNQTERKQLDRILRKLMPSA